MHSTHNEEKSVVAERFIRILKNKIYKHVTAISKNVYIIKLDDMVNDYNNTYDKTIKMTPIDVKYNTYIDSIKEVNNKDRKFHVGNHVRKLKYENIFAKGYTPKWSEEIIVTKKVKNAVPWTCMLLMICMVKISLEDFIKKNSKRQTKKNLERKIIKRKGNKLYVKWKGYDNSLNIWIGKNGVKRNSLV